MHDTLFFVSLKLLLQDGSNLLHAAIKSAELECVDLLLRHISATPDAGGGGLALLYLLTTAKNHHGKSPLALALSMSVLDILGVLLVAGLDLPALIAIDPDLMNYSSPQCLSLISASGKFIIIEYFYIIFDSVSQIMPILIMFLL